MDVNWSSDDLWAQEQANFSAHLAMMFDYLDRRGLDVEDFVRFVGERAIPSWEGTSGAAEMMEGILLNVRSNGHEVIEAEEGEGRARAVVTGVVRHDAMEFYGVPRERADLFWDKFHPLADALGLRFSWRRAGDDRYEIELGPAGDAG